MGTNIFLKGEQLFMFYPTLVVVFILTSNRVIVLNKQHSLFLAFSWCVSVSYLCFNFIDQLRRLFFKFIVDVFNHIRRKQYFFLVRNVERNEEKLKQYRFSTLYGVDEIRKSQNKFVKSIFLAIPPQKLNISFKIYSLQNLFLF